MPDPQPKRPEQLDPADRQLAQKLANMLGWPIVQTAKIVGTLDPTEATQLEALETGEELAEFLAAIEKRLPAAKIRRRSTPEHSPEPDADPVDAPVELAEPPATDPDHPTD